jgi:hypothetical protein
MMNAEEVEVEMGRSASSLSLVHITSHAFQSTSSPIGCSATELLRCTSVFTLTFTFTLLPFALRMSKTTNLSDDLPSQ